MGLVFSFSGRIGRLQYWLTTLGVIAFYVAMFMAMGVSMSMIEGGNPTPNVSGAAAIILFGSIIIGMWINLAAMVRRYHDRNKSGWWFFICLVPLVGPIWQFVELGFLSGTPGGNDFGQRGDSQSSSWSDDDYDTAASGGNRNLDDLIQQRLVERQQRTPAVERSSGNVLTNEKPVFGRRR